MFCRSFCDLVSICCRLTKLFLHNTKVNSFDDMPFATHEYWPGLSFSYISENNLDNFSGGREAMVKFGENFLIFAHNCSDKPGTGADTDLQIEEATLASTK